MRTRLALKFVSAALVVTFTTTQIGWAQDFQQVFPTGTYAPTTTVTETTPPPEPTAVTTNPTSTDFLQGQTLSAPDPTYSKKDLTNAIQVTLEGGMKAFYQNGKLAAIRLVDGTELQDILLSPTGDIQDAIIFYPSSRIDVIRGGKVERSIYDNGLVIEYDSSGRVTQETGPGGVTTYTYVMKGSKLKEVQVRKPDGTLAIYDGKEALKTIQDSTGSLTQFKKGLLSKIQTSDGTTASYKKSTVRTETGEKLNKLTLDTTKFPGTAGDTPVELFYNLTGELLQTKLRDGSTVNFENGLPVSLLDPSGDEITLDYLKSSGILSGLLVKQNGASYSYDSTGLLSKIETGAGTLEINEGEIRRIFLPDGSVLESFTLSTDGSQIVNGTLTSPDGTKRTFESGKVVRIETLQGEIYAPQETEEGLVSFLIERNFSDGTKAIFDHGKLIKIVLSDRGELSDIVLNDHGSLISVTLTETSGEKRYYQEGQLIKRLLPNGILINHSINGPESAILADSTTLELISNDSVRFQHLTAHFESGIISSLDSHFGSINDPVFDGTGALSSGILTRSDGAEIKIQNGKIQETKLLDGTRIVYGQDRIERLEINGVSYELLYEEGKFLVRYRVAGSLQTVSLAKFLLDPDQEKARSILLSEPLIDPLAEKKNVRMGLDTGSSLQGSLVQKEGEEDSFRINTSYRPVWGNVEISAVDDGSIGKYKSLGEWDNLPATVTDFMDIDGDGLPDRVSVNPKDPDHYSVQLNNGMGFDDPVRWDGVVADLSAFYPDKGDNYHRTGLGFFEGRHPHRLAELIDINGDKLPDRVQLGMRGEADWVVQLNNGRGFDAPKWWKGAFPLARIWSFQAPYASEVRNDEGNKSMQELMTDLVDMNGDGKLDRVLIAPQEPYDYWLVQFNTGEGFDFPVVWDNVINDFYYGKHELDGSLSITKDSQRALLSTLLDLDGDKLPDRVYAKLKDPKNKDLGMTWYMQKNNGEGFNDPVVWDETIRGLSLETTEEIAQSIRYQINDSYRQVFVEMMDINGDGLQDRITLNTGNKKEAENQYWWVEINNGTRFDPAVEWRGVETFGNETVGIRFDDEIWHSTLSTAAGTKIVQTDLIDINGDKLPDRVIYTPDSTEWIVQFNNGHGFEPTRVMNIDSLIAMGGAVDPEKYNYVYVRLKLGPAQAGETDAVQAPAQVTIGDQTYDIPQLSSEWQDFYLPISHCEPPLCHSRGSGNLPTTPSPSTGEGGPRCGDLGTSSEHCVLGRGEGEVTVKAVSGLTREILISDIIWMKDREISSKDWMTDLLITESQIPALYKGSQLDLNDIFDSSTEMPPWDHLQDILESRTGLHHGTGGEVTSIQIADGRTAEIESESGKIGTVRGADGSVLELSYDDKGALASTAAFMGLDLTPDSLSSFKYGRLRTLEKEGDSLKYSYEFDSAGREITVVTDPTKDIVERYRDGRLISQKDSHGFETVYEYDAKGELKDSTIYYKGKSQSRFTHANRGGLRKVTSEDGITQEYDAKGAIRFHATADGLRYQHSFIKEQTVQMTETGELIVSELAGGEELHVMKLIEKTLSNGDTAQYDEQGRVVQIEFNPTLPPLNLRGGTGGVINFQYAIDGAETAEIRYADGVTFEYQDGKPLGVHSISGLSIELTDPTSFHYQEALKAWTDTEALKGTFTLAKDTVLSAEYNSKNELQNQRLTDLSTSLYVDGRIDQVLDKTGALEVDYDYNAEGHLTSIHLVKARKELGSALERMRAEMELRQAEALGVVAEREFIITGTVDGRYEETRKDLLAQRAKLEANLATLNGIASHGNTAKNAVAGYLTQVQGGIDSVNKALRDLAKRRTETLAQLHTQIAQAHTEIEGEMQSAELEYEKQRMTAERAILGQEITPVIFSEYRAILGRDPTPTEQNALIDNADFESGFDLEGLKTTLNSSQEKADRETEVAAIKAAVRANLLSVIARSSGDAAISDVIPAEAGIFTPADLGLTPSQTVPLTQEDIDQILLWLDGQGLDLGQCAFGVLESLLQQGLSPGGTVPSRVQLATRLILTDIYAGIITPFEEGKLLISLFALKIQSAHYGLETAALDLSYDSLLNLYNTFCPSTDNCGVKLVAHVDGAHYITIVKVTTDSVTYIDPGLGAEADQFPKTLTKEDFLNIWDGVILAPEVTPLPVTEAERLSEESTMAIRGAFILEIIFAIAAFLIALGSAVVAVASAVISAVAFAVTAITNFVVGFFAYMGGVIGGLFHGLTSIVTPLFNGLVSIGNFFMQGLNYIGGALVKGVAGLIGHLPFGGSLFGTGGFSVKALAVAGMKSLLISGLTYGVGEGLNLLGVPPTITNILTSFAAGFVTGGLNPVGALSGLKTAALFGLGTAAITGLSEIAVHLNLPPPITQAFSLIAKTALTAGIVSLGSAGSALSNFSEIIKTQIPNIVGGLSNIGISTLGNKLGWSPILTQFAGLGVSATLSGLSAGLLRSETIVAKDAKGNPIIQQNPYGILDYVTGTLFSPGAIGGAITIGSGLLLDKLGAPPIASSFISSFLGSYTAASPLGEDISKLLIKGAQRFASAVGTIVGPVVDFGKQVIGTAGQFTAGAFRQTIGAFASVFSRPTQEAIYQDLAGIRQGIASEKDGLWIWQAGNERVVYDPLTGELTEFDGYGATLRVKGLGQDELGHISYDELSHETQLARDQFLRERYTSGSLEEWSYDFADILTLRGTPGDHGTLTAVDIEKGSFHFDLKFDPTLLGEKEPLILDFSFDVRGGVIAEASVEMKPIPTSGSSTGQALDKELYMLTNGIANSEANPYVPPPYILSLMSDLKTESGNQITDQDLAPTPIYYPFFQNMNDIVKFVLIALSKDPNIQLDGDIVKDIGTWALESQNPVISLILVGQILGHMNQFYLNKPLTERSRPIIAMGYSGGFGPLVKSIMAGGLPATSLVAIGAATANMPDLTQEYIQRIIDTSELIEKGMIDGLASHLSILGFTSNVTDTILDFLKNSLIDQAYNLFKNTISALFQFNTGGFPSLLGNSVKTIVNVWGTKDVLAELGIGGKRDIIAGLSTSNGQIVNVEIVGATHFDYFNNGTVRKFVAGLILESKTTQQATDYLLGRPSVSFDGLRKVYVVNLGL